MSGSIFSSGDLRFTKNFFCIFNFYCLAKMISSVSVLCFICILYVFYIGLYVYRLVGITFFGIFEFRDFFIFLLFRCSNLQTFAKCSVFSQLRYVNSQVEHLCLGFQFGELQYLQFLSVGLSSGLVLYFHVCVLLCKGSSLISFPRFDFSASSIVLVCCFCCMCVVVFVRILSTCLNLFFHHFFR